MKNVLKFIKLFCHFTLLLTLINSSSVYGSYTITQCTNPNFCSSFPTAYTSVSFALNETSMTTSTGITKGQTAKTLLLGFSNASFEFNPGVGTITATGTEVTILSYTITATTITVNLTSAGSNTQLNTINFNNLQVRATAVATGYIKRTGGTVKIDNSNLIPSATTVWGNLTSSAPVAYSSSSATQAVTSNVYPATTNNEILGVQVVLTGTCSSLTATAFNFNTTGSTTPATDILNAKLYYTSTTNAFSTGTLYGTVNNPNGSFTISGSQALSLGAATYYFWLTYDIAAYGVAINNDLVDAQFVSSVISGSTNAATSGNPAGTRQISNNTFYSIATGNWSSTSLWSRTSGGASCTCAPTGGNGLVYVDHTITLDNSYTVSYVTVEAGGNLTNAATKILTVANNLITTGNGVFSASTAWSLTNVGTYGTGTSSSSAALTINGTVNVGSGTTLQMTGGAGLTVNGNMTIDGTLALGTSNLTSSNAAGVILNGLGSITGSGTITIGINKTIPTGTNLTVAPVISLSTGVVVTNSGTVNMQNSITGGSSTSTWTNAVNSVLDMGGATSALLTTGILDASAVPNTVKYSGSGNQNIKTPSSSTYYNLYVSSTGTGVKSLQGPLTVNGDIQILTGAQLDAAASANTINLYGNWTNTSTNGTPFNPSTSTVYFNGGSQTLSGSGISSFYNLTIASTGALTSNSSAGKVIISSNWQNDGIFNHNNGDITFNGTSTISGTSITTFKNIIVNATKTLTLHAIETDLAGDLTSNGTLNHNNGSVVFTGSGNTQNINGSSSALTLFQLEAFNPSGNILLSRPLTINDTLILTNGKITTDATNILTLIAGSTVISGSASSYVNGPMKKIGNTSFIFPVGKSATYAPITIGAPSLSTDNFTAEYFPADADVSYSRSLKDASINHISKVEYWMLNRTGGSSNVSVTLSWGSPRSGLVTVLAELLVAGWNGSMWKDLGNGGVTGNTTTGTVINSASVTTYSAFTLASSTANNPLPVKMISFNATAMGSAVKVHWSTASETNNDFFEVQRSKDGDVFESLAKVKGAGNSNTVIDYNWMDENPFQNLSYYRIKQVDFNGAFTYSDVKAIEISAMIKEEDMIVYPNPSNGEFLHIAFTNLNSLSSNVNVQLLDESGKLVFEKKELPVNNQEDTLQLFFNHKLDSGIYLMKLSEGNLTLNKLVMIN